MNPVENFRSKIGEQAWNELQQIPLDQAIFIDPEKSEVCTRRTCETIQICSFESMVEETELFIYNLVKLGN